MNTTTQSETARPPVVAIMGHVDHGKSTLLDFIRNANVVAGEAGGITQHIAAYEVHHTTKEGTERRITFIDTPGHAAFSGMRSRGAHIADIAVLIVSAEDGVKTQTIEAIDIIKKSEVPYIVAINKIDKPNADPERVKMGLMEHGIFLEGYGGNTPYVQISAKTGIGVDDFLETILLVADLEEFSGSPDVPASGFVVESHLDQKRGTSAVLIIKNGTLKKGDYVLVHGALASTRIMENFLGESISKATFSSPIILTGFDTLPEVGAFFETYSNKKEAEARADEYNRLAQEMHEARAAITLDAHQILIPIILKTDVAGTAEAIESEIEKRATDQIVFKVIKTGVGSINESDVQLAISDPQTIILGFNVNTDKKIDTINGIDNVTIQTHTIIYKMLEWLEDEAEKRRPRQEVEETQGVLRVLKTFSSQKNKHVLGGSVQEGSLSVNQSAKLMRKDELVSYGKLVGLQQGKIEATVIHAGNECGLMLECNEEPLPGDMIITFIKTQK